MIERTGVNVHSLDALAPGAPNRLGKQPAAVAKAREIRDQPYEGELALGGFAEIEFEHSHIASIAVTNGIKLDLWIFDDCAKLFISQDEPREPQPGFADEMKQ